jgi:hypothetical protein
MVTWFWGLLPDGVVDGVVLGVWYGVVVADGVSDGDGLVWGVSPIKPEEKNTTGITRIETRTRTTARFLMV